jgi:hypothetical protein
MQPFAGAKPQDRGSALPSADSYVHGCLWCCLSWAREAWESFQGVCTLCAHRWLCLCNKESEWQPIGAVKLPVFPPRTRTPSVDLQGTLIQRSCH